MGLTIVTAIVVCGLLTTLSIFSYRQGVKDASRQHWVVGYEEGYKNAWNQVETITLHKLGITKPSTDKEFMKSVGVSDVDDTRV